MAKITETLVVVRGGGDLATGVIQAFYRAGYKVVVLEIEQPLMIRRNISLGSAIVEGEVQVEDLSAKIATKNTLVEVWRSGKIPVVVDPKGQLIEELKPYIVIDAILAKKNLGTNREMAPITIGLGPGFTAPTDVSVVIETMRGHDLGRVILNGSALENTGVPGIIGGKGHERVVHSPLSGKLKVIKTIGNQVEKGEPILSVNETIVKSPLTGLIRGMIQDGLKVNKGLKIADIDPRVSVDCTTISDKARALGGACLQAALLLTNNEMKTT